MIIVYYLIIYLSFNKDTNDKSNRNFSVLKMITISLIVLQFIIIIFPKNYIEVNMIDVGQGDSTLIKTNNYNILIDGGGSENSSYDVGESVLVPYLLDNTNGTIDVMFISHFHEDHSEGCISVLDKLKVKKIVIGTQPNQTELYYTILKIAKEKNIQIITLTKGDIFSIDHIKFSVLFPDKELQIAEDLNNNSLVIKMEYYSTSILFTGDIEKEAEKILIEEYTNNLNIDILKVAHHGSKSSSIKEFLEYTTPKISLISLGENNKFGHPNEEVLKRLEEVGSKIYRTDRSGEVTLKIYKDGKIKIK